MLFKLPQGYVNTDYISLIIVQGEKLRIDLAYPGTPGSSHPTEQYIMCEYSTPERAWEAADEIAWVHNTKITNQTYDEPF
jgi:hypothetical protein